MLDTNIAIYVIKRRPQKALEQFNRQAEFLCISAISQAELIHGAEKRNYIDSHCKKEQRLLIESYRGL